MEENGKTILEIAHGYTQAMRKINGVDKWVGKVFYNATEARETGNSTALKVLRIDGDNAVMDKTGDDGVKSEVSWPLSDLMYAKAVREAQGFVMFQPNNSVDFSIHLMVSPDGHGYGYLMGEDEL